MPELPEVQTICQELSPLIKNKQIQHIDIYRPDSIGYPTPKDFVRSLLNQKIKDIFTRGKYILISLSKNKILVFHLRLSGQLRYFLNSKVQPQKTERLRLTFNNGDALSFFEPRALGKVYLIHDNKYPKELSGLKNLGLEPTSNDFNYKYLFNKIKNRRAKIKTLLLDQTICAGVGNIYSDEALFLAGIHPWTPANKLSLSEIKKLTRALKLILRRALKTKGSSVRDYLRPDGSSGGYQLSAYVYNREGEKCLKCGAIISFLKFGNRRTRFCPTCQQLR